MIEKTYIVDGMHCASCAQIIGKQIKKIDWIKFCDVNFATRQAVIWFDSAPVDLQILNKHINQLDYHIQPLDAINKPTGEDHMTDHTHDDKPEISKIQLMIIFGMVIIVFLMMLWEVGIRYSRWSDNETIKTFLHHLMPIFATYVFFGITPRFLKATWNYIRYGLWNMDSLIGIGSSIWFLYSFAVTAFENVLSNYMDVSWNFYESVIVVIWLSLIWRYIEHRQLSKNSDAIRSLMKIQAKEATVIGDDWEELKVPLDYVKIGDSVVVKPGETIPVDGIVQKWISEIDESMITWEPLPVTKQTWDDVIWWTINVNGILIIKTTKLWSDSVLSNIITMVTNAQNLKPKIQKFADTIAAYFVPIVIALATLTVIGWLVFGKSLVSDYWIRGIVAFVAIMSIACPCALWLATPLGVINGITRATKNGILVKNTDWLLWLKDIDIVVFDKTGTITTGKPSLVIDDYLDKKNLDHLTLLYTLEKWSTHPIAHAITTKSQSLWLSPMKLDNYLVTPWLGIKWDINGNTYYAGNVAYARQILWSIFDESIVDNIIEDNQTPVILFDDKEVKSIYRIMDTIKDNIKDVISELHSIGIQTAMCTGDRLSAAQWVADTLWIDYVVTQATPNDKSDYIKSLRDSWKKVAMVGDGINDSIALSLADVSVSMSNGSDISIQSSDLVLLKWDLQKLLDAIHISKWTNKLIYQNLFWAFSYNIIGIPLAWWWLFPILWWQLNPVFSGIFMATSSLIVVLNSLRNR